MDAEPADQDLLLLSLNLSDSEPDEAANPANSTSGSAPTTEYHPTRAERTALSEEAFQALKRTYRPKIENGNIYKTTLLPTPTTTASTTPPAAKAAETTPLTKPQNQSLLHAAEELYFFHRFHEAAAFLRQVLAEADGRVDGETKKLLGFYLGRCEARLAETGREGGETEREGGETKREGGEVGSAGAGAGAGGEVGGVSVS